MFSDTNVALAFIAVSLMWLYNYYRKGKDMVYYGEEMKAKVAKRKAREAKRHE